MQWEKRQNELGSSTMMHKVNPVDFEACFSTLQLSNCLLNHIATHLPVNRFQKEASDIPIIRSIGTALAYSLVGYKHLIRGMTYLQPDPQAMEDELNQYQMMLGEAVMVVMKQNGLKDPFKRITSLTQGKKGFSREEYLSYVQGLDLD
eukprot:NODE_788_length_1449_cov_128.174286_g651_i0.p2 GENE.NODE_788_length_1449_cov_128.174286_g651_i0~~NODE_788_length_1449_cov_128.174286_g651_i0.p2  ORF type:complete len:148 (-),score=15.07 NODE_788_length_1449_cov_128.174286_g651_i0:82-525(-)